MRTFAKNTCIIALLMIYLSQLEKRLTTATKKNEMETI